MNQRPKALILARAKKFIPSQQLVTNFYFKGTQQFTGCFPTMIGFVTLGHLLFAKKVAKGNKPNHGWKTPCKLLCAFEVKVSNKLLARYKLLGPS